MASVLRRRSAPRLAVRGPAAAAVGFVALAATASPARSEVGGLPVQLTAVAYAGTGAAEFFDTATLTGGVSPRGTVTFHLFGPDDDTCSGPPVFTSVEAVNGVGTGPVTVTSDHVLLSTPGVYHFVASYSGDALHQPAGPTDCLDPDQAVGFASSSFTFSAQASPATTVGGTISDSATIATIANPTGTMAFRLYGPDDPGCTGAPILTSVRPVDGNGTYHSASYTPIRPGTYRWVAAYSGDGDDPSAESSCDDPSQRVEVAQAAPAPSYRCTVIAQQRLYLEGWMQALQSSLSVGLDPSITTVVNGAVESTWRARFDAATQGMGCD
jgi:hypothetical protein